MMFRLQKINKKLQTNSHTSSAALRLLLRYSDTRPLLRAFFVFFPLENGREKTKILAVVSESVVAVLLLCCDLRPRFPAFSLPPVSMELGECDVNGL